MLGVAKYAALAALLLENVFALSNTSPAMLLSFQEPLASLDAAAAVAPTMDDVFRTLAPAAVQNCNYDAYLFVKQSNVSENQINAHSMPYLAHLVEKAGGKYVQGAVIASLTAEVDASVSELKTSIASQCGAAVITANLAEKIPFALYTDTKPRVIGVDLVSDMPLAAADAAIKQIVGHIPSGKFLVAYYTTPSTYTATESAGDAMPEDDVVYESVFRNYQFFSPALFMGILASLFFLAVFGIAFRAVQSLQISHAAFEPRRDVPKKN